MGVDAAGRITSKGRVAYCEKMLAQHAAMPVPASCPEFGKQLTDRGASPFRCTDGRMHECALAMSLSQHAPTCYRELRVRFLDNEDTPLLLRLADATGEACAPAQQAYACAERPLIRNRMGLTGRSTARRCDS